jgi:hypothetical protein
MQKIIQISVWKAFSHRRNEIGRKALTELVNFRPFQSAEKWVADNLALLERKMVDIPSPPTVVADVMLATEIRAHVVKQESPVDFVVKSISDPRILGAVLNAPSFLSGLNDAEFNLIRERARQALHPEQTNMEKQLTRALEELREGLAATKHLLLARCEMREDDDGQFRSIREPLPRGRLTAVPKTSGEQPTAS